jgi:tetratricopeptide (TPR) repeat protein
VVRQYLEVCRKLTDDFPSEGRAWHSLGDAYMSLADLRNRTGKFQEAVEALRQEVHIRKKLAAEFPLRLIHQLRIATSNLALGDALRKTGAQDKAMAAYQEAITACKEIIRRKPELPLGYVKWGEAVVGMGAPNEAVTAWEQAVQLGAKHAAVANDIAWFLATTPHTSIPHPEKAVELAQKAVALEPQNGSIRNTLGVAYYRMGQWQEAVVTLKKAMQLRSGGDSGDWFFLAMAQQQLGDAVAARKWYDRAVQWMDKNRPQDEELRHFRAEAAALLGIEEEPLKKQSAINEQPSAEKASMPQKAN